MLCNILFPENDLKDETKRYDAKYTKEDESDYNCGKPIKMYNTLHAEVYTFYPDIDEEKVWSK